MCSVVLSRDRGARIVSHLYTFIVAVEVRESRKTYELFSIFNKLFQ